MFLTFDKYLISILITSIPISLLLILLCIFIGLLRRNKANIELQERIIFEEGLTPDIAGRLVCLIRTRQWLLKKNYLVGTRRRYKRKTNMDELCQYEFYTIVRWIMQLESAKDSPDPDAMWSELDIVINSMKEHANKFRVPEPVQQEIMQLCRISPKQGIRKYDKYFVKSSV